jgi:hypothetical protein
MHRDTLHLSLFSKNATALPTYVIRVHNFKVVLIYNTMLSLVAVVIVTVVVQQRKEQASICGVK